MDKDLKEIYERGSIDILYRKGFISHIPKQYLDISRKVDELKASGLRQSQAVRMVAKNMRISARTVQRAVQKTK